MSRMYAASFKGLSVSAICELFYIKAPADAVIRIHEIKVTQETIEVSEQLPVRVFKTATDQSAKGDACDSNPLSTGDVATGAAVRKNILTAATFATETTPLLSFAENILNGYHVLPTPECRIDLSPSAGLVVKLDTAPAGATTFAGYMIFEEIGG